MLRQGKETEDWHMEDGAPALGGCAPRSRILSVGRATRLRFRQEQRPRNGPLCP